MCSLNSDIKLLGFKFLWQLTFKSLIYLHISYIFYRLLIYKSLRGKNHIILYVPTSSDNFLSSRKWLTVDLEHKRLYCFPCLLFAKKRKGPWVDSGFIKLSYLLGALEKHEGQEHPNAIIEQKLFLKRTSHLEVWSLIFMSRNRASQRDSLSQQRDHQKNNQCCYLPGKRKNGVPWARQETHFRGQRAL